MKFQLPGFVDRYFKKQEGLKKYQESISSFLADSELSVEETDKLAELQKEFGLSAEMCTLAKQDNNVSDIRNESFSSKMSFNSKEFGLIVSKYAIQTAQEIKPIYDEVYRLLDDQGYFTFLVVHPMRQFIEKKKQGKDYFKKELVESIIFDGKITVTEASHTLSEYLNSDFLNKFSLVDIKEGYDFPASEQINGDIYPTFLIIVVQKK